MKTAIIMPTIQVPPNLEAWASQLEEGDGIFIAGNQISPDEAIEKRLREIGTRFGLITRYLRNDDPFCLGLEINKFMEPNHHHRRNFALAYALHHQPEIVVTIDDDNFPKPDDWISQVHARLTQPNETLPVVSNETTAWLNPGILCQPVVMHRGFPLSMRHSPVEVKMFEPNGETIGVFAALWTGDPDIDALERIVNAPYVNRIVDTLVWGLDTMAPFDSQSTAIRADIAPLLFMWTYVGRYDDIWASYLVRRVMRGMGYHIAYGNPGVHQNRNPHNLLKDLDTERLGYQWTERLIEVLDSVDLNGTDPLIDQFRDILIHLENETSFIPDNTLAGLRAWVADMDLLGIGQ